MLSRDEILAEIRRVARENEGRPLGRIRFREATGITEADWLGKHWASWGEAIRAAGLEPQGMNARLDETEVLSKLADLTRKLGQFPTKPQMQLARRADDGFPSHGAVARIGSKSAVQRRLLAFVRSRPDLADIAEIISPLADGTEAASDDDALVNETTSGFIYLIKMGKYYKIGLTTSLERRGRELAIQLPDEHERVHSIRTDDVRGIEAYWHRRFAAKRKNGEWFALSSADVRAFRRRKFQ